MVRLAKRGRPLIAETAPDVATPYEDTHGAEGHLSVALNCSAVLFLAGLTIAPLDDHEE